jgi:homospermidine synthase
MCCRWVTRGVRIGMDRGCRSSRLGRWCRTTIRPSLQVTAAVLRGIVWALENPPGGIGRGGWSGPCSVLEVAEPYLGDMVVAYSDRTLLLNQGRLFPEVICESCPLQFANFRVT